MNSLCFLSGFGSYVPERVLTNHELEGMMDTTDEWIRTRTGICERHVVAANENVSDLAFQAAQKALQNSGINASSVTHIFTATCSPEHLCPSVACILADKLGMNSSQEPHGGHRMLMDFNAACSGFVYGLELGQAILCQQPDAVILLVAAEALSRRMNYADRSTSVLFGDGAGAVVLTSKALPCNGVGPRSAKLQAVSCGADGTLNQLIVVGGGTSLNLKVGEPVPAEFFTTMQGREVFKQAVRCMARECTNLLGKAGLELADIDLFIAHQANMRIIEAVGQRLNVPAHKTFCNVQSYGNTSAASIPLAIDDALNQGVLQPGMQVLLTTFGGGLTWGAALLEF